MHYLLLALVFLLELVAFIGVASLAFLAPASPGLQLGLGLLLLLGIGSFWGVFMAPKSPRRLQGRAYYIVKAIIYILAAIGLRHIVVAVTFLGLSLACEIALRRHKS